MWEVIRSARSVVTVAEICHAMGTDQRLVQRQLDLLARHGLVDSVRARVPRKSVGYRVATERIVVTFDDRRQDSVQRAMDSGDSVRRDFDRCVDRYSDPAFHPASGVRFRQHSIQHFTKEDFAGLRRRMLAVIEFLGSPRPRPPQPHRARTSRVPPPRVLQPGDQHPVGSARRESAPLAGGLDDAALEARPRRTGRRRQDRPAGACPSRARGGARARARTVQSACRRAHAALGAHGVDLGKARVSKAAGVQPGSACSETRGLHAAQAW